MAIIYSYPLNLNILDTDVIIGTTTQLINGRPKNQTKSFKIEDLANYFIPTLNQVLQVGNVSQLDAKIGELYLYDDAVGGYAKMSVSDNVFMLDSIGGVTILTIDNGTNLVLNNGLAAAQIINPLTTNRTYTLPDKSGTFALTTDAPTLQQVVDIGNSINLAVDDTEAIIVNMSAASTVAQKGIRVTMPTQTAGSFPYSDCFIAKINGQSPGTLSNNVSGFYAIAQSGADNRSFVSEHAELVTASKHFSASNYTTATSDFASFNTNNVEVFNIDYLGNTTANTLSVYDGPNGEYCKIAINDGYFTISRPDGVFTTMLSTEYGDNLILTNSNGAAAQILNNLLVSRNYTLPNASGTFALTSDLTVPTLQLVTDSGDTTSNDITANSFIKSSGTSDQILLADGSTSSLAAKANLASPTFTGTPTLPTGTIATTQTALDNSTKLATTAFVTTADDLKADKSMSAYSVRVNNTASTANETEVTYRAPGQQVYTGTIIWTGTTAPSGTTNFSYNWIQIGNQVTLKITLLYSTVGLALTNVLLTLPSDCPNPIKPNGLTNANNNLYSGVGYISLSASTIPSANSRVLLKSNAGNNGFDISATTGSATVAFTDISIQYFTS